MQMWLWYYYYLPLIEINDHLPNPWGSLPEVVISEQKGWRVIIVVPHGLYKSVYSISVSEVELWEICQCRLVVVLRDASRWGYCQWVLISAKQAMLISNWPILLHISSTVWWPEDISKLFTFWKSIRVCFFLRLGGDKVTEW